MVQTGNDWNVTAALSAGGKSVLIDDSGQILSDTIPLTPLPLFPSTLRY